VELKRYPETSYHSLNITPRHNPKELLQLHGGESFCSCILKYSGTWLTVKQLLTFRTSVVPLPSRSRSQKSLNQMRLESLQALNICYTLYGLHKVQWCGQQPTTLSDGYSVHYNKCRGNDSQITNMYFITTPNVWVMRCISRLWHKIKYTATMLPYQGFWWQWTKRLVCILHTYSIQTYLPCKKHVKIQKVKHECLFV
jgi:hypothetical protein